MKTLTAHALESEFDLRASSVSEKAIDAIDLTDEELEKATGSWFGGGFGGFGGGFGGFGGGFGGFGCCFPIVSFCCFPIFSCCGGWGW